MKAVGTVVRLASVATDTNRDRRREWLARLRDDRPKLAAAAADQKLKLASIFGVAGLLASGRFPSFWKEGIYAKQSTIGADPSLGLSDRHIRRIIGFLADRGYICHDRRPGRTSLIRPSTPDIMFGVNPGNRVRYPGHHVRGTPDIESDTPDTMSDDLTNLKSIDPKNYPLPQAPANGQAANGQPNKNRDSGGAAHALGAPGELLRSRLGDDLFAAWFGKATIESECDGVVALAVPTRFMRKHIEAKFGDALLTCWREIEPATTAIKIEARG
jgi:DnaA N-terminal domain